MADNLQTLEAQRLDETTNIMSKELMTFGVLPKIELPTVISVDDESIQARDLIVIKAKGLKPIVDAQSCETAVAVGVDIRKIIKAVEQRRKELKAPVISAGKLLDKLSDDYIAPLLAEQNRIEAQAAVWQRKENDRIAAEQRKQEEAQRELARLAQEAQRRADETALKVKGEKTLEKAVVAQQQATEAQEQFMTAVAAPTPEVVKPKGATFKQVLKMEVTDIKKVYAHNPVLCKPLELSPAAVKMLVFPTKGATKDNPYDVVPGLKLWWEYDVSFRA